MFSDGFHFLFVILCVMGLEVLFGSFVWLFRSSLPLKKKQKTRLVLGDKEVLVYVSVSVLMMNIGEWEHAVT